MIKKGTLLICLCGFAMSSFSQALGYQDLALLFSKDQIAGTARFNAMSGAFGALGGDVSAIKINPAGAAVFNNSLATISLNTRNTATLSNYYNTTNSSNDNYFNFSQTGAVIVFDNYNSSNWNKVTFSFNYSIRNDFRNDFFASGNSGYTTFEEFPLDTNNPKTQYSIADAQNFSNNYSGDLSEYNFAIAGQYNKNLYVGLSFNSFDLKFSQKARLTELNSAANNSTLDVNFYQENITTGSGFSLGAGFIYKLGQNLRIGGAYETPIWFTSIVENTNIVNNDGFLGDTQMVSSEYNVVYDNTAGNYYPSQFFEYKLKTPGKMTASLAYVFGSNGLFSMDYTYKNYETMKLSKDNFTTENQFFSNELRNTFSLNLGTEWRFKAISLRGGYHFEQSPDKNAIDSDNIKGFSFGAGYKFNNASFDFSYQKNTQTALYNFYPQYNQVNAANLNIDHKIITATLTIYL